LLPSGDDSDNNFSGTLPQNQGCNNDQPGHNLTATI
jgi:hypothetical protein